MSEYKMNDPRLMMADALSRSDEYSPNSIGANVRLSVANPNIHEPAIVSGMGHGEIAERVMGLNALREVMSAVGQDSSSETAVAGLVSSLIAAQQACLPAVVAARMDNRSRAAGARWI